MDPSDSELVSHNLDLERQLALARQRIEQLRSTVKSLEASLGGATCECRWSGGRGWRAGMAGGRARAGAADRYYYVSHASPPHPPSLLPCPFPPCSQRHGVHG